MQRVQIIGNFKKIDLYRFLKNNNVPAENSLLINPNKELYSNSQLDYLLLKHYYETLEEKKPYNYTKFKKNIEIFANGKTYEIKRNATYNYYTYAKMIFENIQKYGEIKCEYCLTKLTTEKVSVDHFIPKSLGG